MIQVVILAAGLSTRMRPLTDNVPKPMLKLAGKPVLQHVIENLRDSGIIDIIITTHYLPWVIKNYFGDGSQFGIKITYSYEKRLLDTAGSLKKIESILDDQFLVCGGHFILPTINLNSFLDYHCYKGGVGTIAFRKTNELDNLKFFGQGVLDSKHELIYFAEKPEKSISNYIHTTYQIFNKEVLKYIPKNTAVSIPDFLIPQLLINRVPLFGYFTNSELINISTNELYERAHAKVRVIS